MNLLFDCDGTLLDSMHMWLFHIEKVQDKLDREFTKEELTHIESLPLDQFCHYVTKNFIKDKDPDEFKSEILSDVKNHYQNILLPKEFVVENLHRLKKKGHSLAIASSTDRRLLHLAFERLNLLELFDFFATPDTLGLNKSTVEFWQKAKGMFNKEDKTWLFDDAIYALNAAKSADIVTVGVADIPHNENEIDELKKTCHYFIDDFSQIKKIEELN